MTKNNKISNMHKYMRARSSKYEVTEKWKF